MSAWKWMKRGKSEDRLRTGRAPSLEPLEPRLLLDANSPGAPDEPLLQAPLGESAVMMDLHQEGGGTGGESPILAQYEGETAVYFPDANLKQAVVDALRAQGIITTDPTPSEMLELSSLSASGKGIIDLTGLEYATNLTWLDLWNNQITSVAPLASLTNLRELHADGNQITNVIAHLMMSAQ